MSVEERIGMSEIKHFKQLGFTVIAEPSEYCVDYKVYEIHGTDDSGNLSWLKAGDGSFDYVESLAEAELFLHGRPVIQFDLPVRPDQIQFRSIKKLC